MSREYGILLRNTEVSFIQLIEFSSFTKIIIKSNLLTESKELMILYHPLLSIALKLKLQVHLHLSWDRL